MREARLAEGVIFELPEIAPRGSRTTFAIGVFSPRR
jgi:hypothetical protein